MRRGPGGGRRRRAGGAPDRPTATRWRGRRRGRDRLRCPRGRRMPSRRRGSLRRVKGVGVGVGGLSCGRRHTRAGARRWGQGGAAVSRATKGESRRQAMVPAESKPSPTSTRPSKGSAPGRRGPGRTARPASSLSLPSSPSSGTGSGRGVSSSIARTGRYAQRRELWISFGRFRARLNKETTRSHAAFRVGSRPYCPERCSPAF